MATLAIAVVACNKPAPEKAEVEAGFAENIAVPTVSIDAESFTTDGITATVKVKVDGISEETKTGLSVGLVYGTDPTFQASEFAPVETPENGTYELKFNVVSNSKTYLRASASNAGGSTFSETVEKDIPDVAFHLKVAGKYVAEIESEAWGDKYTHEIEIIVDEEDPIQCVVSGWEPYYLKKYGLKYPQGNCCFGILDDATSTITIKNQSPMYLYDGNDNLAVGADAASWAETKNFADIVFKGTEDGNLYRAGAIGTMSFNDESGKYEFEDQYFGDVTYKKQ